MSPSGNWKTGGDSDRADEFRSEHACSACHRRKLKCDRELPPRGCSTCRKSAIPCLYTGQRGNEIGRSTTRAGRRKPRGPYRKGQTPREKELENYVQILTKKTTDLEAQLQQVATNVDSPKLGDYSSSVSLNVTPPERLSNAASTSHELSISNPHQLAHLRPELILELWLRYVFAVDPFTKLIHCPTIAEVVLSTKCRQTSQTPEIEALMLSVYITSLNSLEVSELQCNLDVPKEDLVSAWRASLDCLLLQIDADPNSMTLVSLQAALIYLGSLRRQAGCDKSLNISSLFDLSKRLVFHLKLHEPSTYSSLSPFEAEYSRRAWWTLRRFESAYAEDFGKKNSLVTYAGVPLPFDYNDSDLDPSMTVYPVPREGISEISVLLLQFKVVQILSCLNSLPSQMMTMDNLSPGWTSNGLGTETRRYVEDIKTEIEQEILSKCDASRPFEWLILLIGRVVLTKVEILLLEPPPNTDANARKNAYQDMKVPLALDIIECHQIIATDPRLRKWQWFWKNTHQWHSTIFVLEVIADRPDAVFANRVWQVINFVMTTPNILDKHGMDIEMRSQLLDGHGRALQAREQLMQSRTGVLATTLT